MQCLRRTNRRAAEVDRATARRQLQSPIVRRRIGIDRTDHSQTIVRAGGRIDVDRDIGTEHYCPRPSQRVAPLIVRRYVGIEIDRRCRDIEIAQRLRATDRAAKGQGTSRINGQRKSTVDRAAEAQAANTNNAARRSQSDVARQTRRRTAAVDQRAAGTDAGSVERHRFRTDRLAIEVQHCAA